MHPRYLVATSLGANVRCVRIHCHSPTLCRWQTAIARSELVRACEKSDRSSNTKKLAHARRASINCVTFPLQFPRLIRITNQLANDKGLYYQENLYISVLLFEKFTFIKSLIKNKCSVSLLLL